MPSEVISALIGLLGVIFSAGVSLQLVNWRLKSLEDKMDDVDKHLKEHNNYAVKFAEVSGDIKAIRTELENLKEK